MKNKVKVTQVTCLRIKVGEVTKKCFRAKQATNFYMGYRFQLYTTVPPAQIQVNNVARGRAIITTAPESPVLTNRRKRLESRVLAIFKKYLP